MGLFHTLDLPFYMLQFLFMGNVIQYFSESTWLLIWFFPPRFLEWEFLSDRAISWSLPNFTFLEFFERGEKLWSLNECYMQRIKSSNKRYRQEYPFNRPDMIK